MCKTVRMCRQEGLSGVGCGDCASAEAQGWRAGGRGSPDPGRRAQGSRQDARIWLRPGTAPAHLPLPAPLRLRFPQQLFTIQVPVVHNHQFDKFRSSLLIIIISLHSAQLQEFNNSMNNRRTMIRNPTTKR